MRRRVRPGTPAWYAAMSDRRLQFALQALKPEGREWLIIKQLLDDRARKRLRRRAFLLKAAGILLVILASAVVVIMALR